ncbi:DUF4304 domain-containing protein [Micromonospora sp. NBRC 107095]|uniref:DUF4304 domain-containing protein n=1 Tax=Micromonospora sp. NBRC 107095 TaxID=3032209 RepID=UPI0024A2768C|nr:DUF4304 domain-containing protein [Micromonospora sp. NBRC 107095]GLZ57296.1 hypothetical protein Misp05_08720 [Micromonospora sp. NBRC 107095]
MERPVRQAYLNMIAMQVGPVLRGHGFKRSHGSFRRISDAGHAAIIEFQGSTGSWGDTSLFYVNLGVATASWLDWFQERLGGNHRDRPTASVAQWWTRLTAASRHSDGFDRWAIRSVEEADVCGGEVARELSERVIPIFDALLAHYVQLDEALANGRKDDLPALFHTRPSDPLNGIDHFGRLDHSYVAWMLSRRS